MTPKSVKRHLKNALWHLLYDAFRVTSSWWCWGFHVARENWHIVLYDEGRHGGDMRAVFPPDVQVGDKCLFFGRV